jgi:alpha-galactosidase
MLDAHPDLSLCPEAARSFSGQPGLVMMEAKGAPMLPRFTLCDTVQETGALTVICTDAALGLTYEARIALDPETHVIALQAWVRAEQPLRLTWLAAPVLPAPPHAEEMIDVSGR